MARVRYRRAHLQWCTAMRFTAHSAAIKTSERPEEVSEMLLTVQGICRDIADPFGAALCSQTRVYAPPALVDHNTIPVLV